MFIMIALGIAGGVLTIGLKKGGFLTTSDVGGLAELAPIQSQLMPLDACKIHYFTRDKNGNRFLPESIFVDACSNGPGGGPAVVVVKVDPTWARKNVGFEMKRSSPSQRWKVLVEKDDVPFPDLKGALEDFAPKIVERYDATRKAQAARQNASQTADEQNRKAAEDRKNGAKGSYPSK